MGFAKIRISPELFREWLPLPPSSTIVGSQLAVGEVTIVVADPQLPGVVEGAEPVEATPVFSRKNGPVEFVSWGLRS